LTAAGDRLAGRVAVVTGAGNGIGRGEAEALAAEGARVVVNDRPPRPGDEDLAETVAAAIREAGGEAVGCAADIGTFEGCRTLIEAATTSFGGLDIVVNNAGAYRVGRLEDFSDAEWDDVIRVNINGVYGTIRYATPIFKAQGHGIIVNTSSSAGLGIPGQLAYATSKEAIVGLTRSVARELGPFGIRCNAIRPRAAGTAMAAQSAASLGAWRDVRAALGNYSVGEITPLMSAGPASASQVGAFVAWLCTDTCRSVNGRVFLVSGDVVGLFDEPVPATLERSGGWSIEQLEHDGGRHLIAGLVDHFAVPEAAFRPEAREEGAA